MPTLSGDDQYAVEAPLGMCIQLPLHLTKDFLLRLLTQGVGLADLLREGRGFLFILTEQEAQRTLRRAHAARRIDARSQCECDADGGERLIRASRLCAQC